MQIIKFLTKQVVVFGVENEFDIVKKLINTEFLDDAIKIINSPDKYGQTLLHKICCDKIYDKTLEKLIFLIKYCHEKTIIGVDNYSNTPLNLICSRTDIDQKNIIEIVKLLLPFYTQDSINLPNKEEKTPFYWAGWNDNLELTKILYLNGAKNSSRKGACSAEIPEYWNLTEKYESAQDKINHINEKIKEENCTEDLLDVILSCDILYIVNEKTKIKDKYLKDTIFYKIKKDNEKVIEKKLLINKILRKDMKDCLTQLYPVVMFN
jgi:ankyrin repeat protein